MGNRGFALLLATLTLAAALPLAQAKTYEANLLVVDVTGLKDLPSTYTFESGTTKSYTVVGRLTSFSDRVSVNVTSPSGKRSADDATLRVDYPVDWTRKGFLNDTKARTEEESARVSFVLGRLPADPPTNGATVRASVESSVFYLRILPPTPVLVLEAPADDGIAFVDLTGDAPISVRTLYFPEGDKLTGPVILGGKNLGMAGDTSAGTNKRIQLRTNADVPCGLHQMTAASQKWTSGISTAAGSIMAAGEGSVDAVAVLRTPSVSFPAGFVTDVAPAELHLRCFPPKSEVELTLGGAGVERSLGRFTVADSGGLEEFVTFPDLGAATTVTVSARVVRGPAVLDLAKYATNSTVTVRDVENADELNLKVDATLDRVYYEIGDRATVAGRVTVAGEPAQGADVTVVWPFEDPASTREDRLQAKTVKSGADGSFSIVMTAAPSGQGSLSPTSTQGEREVVVTARKVGLNTGVDRVPFLSTGVAPLTVQDLRWRPEVTQPDQDATLTGRIVVPTVLQARSLGLAGSRVVFHTTLVDGPTTATAGADGTFSLTFKVPAGAATGVYASTVLAFGPAPDAAGGVLLGPGVNVVPLKVGALDAKPADRLQRATVEGEAAGGSLEGLATVVRSAFASPQPTPATTGLTIADGDRIVVSSGGDLDVLLPDQGAHVRFENGTRASVALHRTLDGAAKTVLVLDVPGRILVDSQDAGAAGRTFLVVGRFHDVSLENADAVLTSRGDGGLDVEVWRGTVAVTNRGGPTKDVGQGETLALAGDRSVNAGTSGRTSGTDPFAPPPSDDGEEDGGDDGPGTGDGDSGGRDSPLAPWLALAAVAVALLARRRR